MILTPIAMRRGSHGLGLQSEANKETSSPPRRPSHQLLDVPKLDLSKEDGDLLVRRHLSFAKSLSDVLDQEKRKPSKRDPRTSLGSSDESRKTDSFHAGVPASGDALLKSEPPSSELKDEEQEGVTPGVPTWLSVRSRSLSRLQQILKMLFAASATRLSSLRIGHGGHLVYDDWCLRILLH